MQSNNLNNINNLDPLHLKNSENVPGSFLALPKSVPSSHEAKTIYKKEEFIIDSRYELISILGKGSYGTVCSAIDINNNNNPIAIKKVCKIFTKDVLLKRALREVKLMIFFRGHKNIISLIDIDLSYKKPYEGLYCFQELMDHDLARVIVGSAQFSNLMIQSFIYQILCGIKYIHSADVIHRDIKPNNILVTAQGILKICDFGLARGINEKWMYDYNNKQITSYVATRWYRAPELILAKKLYGKEVDMWSIGCIIGELYGRKPLFIGNDSIKQIIEICKVLGAPNREIIQSFKSKSAVSFFFEQPCFHKRDWGLVYPLMPLDCQTLIDNLLMWNPKKRYTAEQALNHSFLLTVRNPDSEASTREIFNFEFEKNHHSMNEMEQLLNEEIINFKVQKKGQ
ncbi:mitogen-activated protein kinase [Martiniozyma asiatica (nom. inval.)]|nr:mitogen-activated protein kinase [Martiniozyma asiatica]